MAKKHEVQCRICKQYFDANALKENVDWIQPSRGWYYHVQCYKDWKVADSHTDEEWVELIYDFLARDLKVSYDWFVCEAQRKKFIKDNTFTNKGIYFTLKYFYEVKKGDVSKMNGGIGIIPYVYKEATQYWTELELRRRGTISEIEQQIRERALREVIPVVKKSLPKTKKDKWSLEDI